MLCSTTPLLCENVVKTYIDRKEVWNNFNVDWSAVSWSGRTLLYELR